MLCTVMNCLLVAAEYSTSRVCILPLPVKGWPGPMGTYSVFTMGSGVTTGACVTTITIGSWVATDSCVMTGAEVTTTGLSVTWTVPPEGFFVGFAVAVGAAVAVGLAVGFLVTLGVGVGAT